MTTPHRKPDDLRAAASRCTTRDDYVGLAIAIDSELAAMRARLQDPNMSKTLRSRTRQDRTQLAALKSEIQETIRKLRPDTTLTLDYRVLAYAIWEHKRAAETANLEPEPHDEALWATLEHIDQIFLTPQRNPTPPHNPA